MQAIGRQPQRAPDGALLHYERHRPEQTDLYRLVLRHAASFIAHTEAGTHPCVTPAFKRLFGIPIRCLRFHETERGVRTPSRWQVRQPIYRDSVARWRHYDP